MSAADDSAAVLPFVADVLAREGAALEPTGATSLFVVLPNALQQALDLPSASTLDLAATSAEDTVPFPLEGAGMQWCVERARARGRRAGAFVPMPPLHPSGRLAKARERLVLPNAKVVSAEATRPVATRVLLEFGYEAQSEERIEGRAHVAVTATGIASQPLAEALGASLPDARAEPPALDEAGIRRAARCAEPTIERDVRARLAPFRARCQRRLEAERDRIVAYHERLARESRRRRGATQDETLAARREAILRQRDERLADAAERHAVEAGFWLASALVLRYEVVRCRFRLRRRRREIDLALDWDPLLGDFLGRPCAACRSASFTLHVCDDAGHATCERCAARCARCERRTCRACTPGGCGCGS